jgi:hypothetical protein
MAGRNVSVTHEALGTVRVMKTGGMIGEVVGKAASICVKNDCSPREVYERYFGELKELLQLPGAARRATINAAIALPADYKPLPPPADLQTATEAPEGIKVSSLPGLVVDDAQAKLSGNWSKSGGGGLKGYVGTGYIYRSAKDTGSARFEFTIPTAGLYEVRVSYGAHENRASKAPVSIESAEGLKQTTIDQKQEPALPQGFVSVGKYRFEPGKPSVVGVGGTEADGNVHADAVQLVPVR